MNNGPEGRRINRYGVLVAGALLALLLAGCKTLGPTWSLSVINWQSVGTDPAFTLLVCKGGLRGTVVAGTQVSMTVAVGPEDDARETTRHAGNLRVGALVLIEATCTDEEGDEVGYARVEGRVGPPQHTT